METLQLLTHEQEIAKIWAARTMCLELMKQHGVDNYTFRFLSSHHTYGRCNYTRKQIGLSKKFIVSPHVTTEDIRNVCLHEIAHALEPTAGHGPAWVARAISIGCDGKKCSEIRTLKKNSHWYQCDKCQYQLERLKQISTYRLMFTVTHRNCGGHFRKIVNEETLQSLRMMDVPLKGYIDNEAKA